MVPQCFYGVFVQGSIAVILLNFNAKYPVRTPSRKTFVTLNKYVTLFSLIVLFSALISCKKKPVDYREKYLGNYQITYFYSFWQLSGGTNDTTILYNGQINYGDIGRIKIDWYDGSEREFEVSEKGGIIKCNSSLGTIDNNNFELTFTDDLCGNGPIGANYTITLTGAKQ